MRSHTYDIFITGAGTAVQFCKLRHFKNITVITRTKHANQLMFTNVTSFR